VRSSLIIPALAGLCVTCASLAWGAWGGRGARAGTPWDAEPTVEIVTPTTPAPHHEVTTPGGCHSGGCSLAKHPIPEFSAADFRDALAEYALAPADSPSPALEKLLFYGSRTRELIDRYGEGTLPAAHSELLRRELARTHALVAMRMIDDAGAVVAAYEPEAVPIGVKQHLHTNSDAVQPFEMNGTVMRVGLSHLWSRY
jgi:hypothetical protein